MAHDISRSALYPAKHFRSVLGQQGRLFTDDDINEADALAMEERRHINLEVIGPSGSPDSGFQISAPVVNANGIDFSLAAGTMYVGGLRVTLEAPETFQLQKDWLEQTSTDRPAPGAERVDLVYLEAWEQPVTAVEDSELLEVALGGPDTAARMRRMNRVRVLTNVGTDSCADAWAKLGPLGPGNEKPTDAMLKVGYVPNTDPAGLCSPTVTPGYLGADNQTIRVEIGSGGNTLRWSYDNCSRLYRVQLTKDLNGNDVVHLNQPPKDEDHWPLAGQTVEFLPWSALLPNHEKVAELNGALASVTASYDPDTRFITVNPMPTGLGTQWQQRTDHVDIQGNDGIYYYMRVWQHGGQSDTATETPFTPGIAVELPGTGLTVTITGTQLRPGLYWTLAARPMAPQNVVPWAFDDPGRPAEGTRYFYAPLGLIHWRPYGQTTLFDCRALFDPLTKMRGSCCVSVSPGSGWEHVIDEHASEQDVCFCFQPGDFETSRTLVFTNRNVKIEGAFGASRVTASGVETLFRFEGCNSVEIRDISLRTSALVQEAHGDPKPHYGGTVTAHNCNEVTLENLFLRNASGPVKSGSCIALYNDAADQAMRASVARVTGCELTVGANQNGISVINFGRSTIADNNLHVDPAENRFLPEVWFQNAAFRANYRRTLVQRFGIEKPPARSTRLTLRADKSAWIATADELEKPWMAMPSSHPFTGRSLDRTSLGQYVHRIADKLVVGRGSLDGVALPAFQAYLGRAINLRTATGLRSTASQGIVVAGTQAGETRIVGNSVRDFVQGIHVGFSHKTGRSIQNFDIGGRIEITHNFVHISLMPEAASERHGVFAGNADSVLIENNRLECERLGEAQHLEIDGIRVYGYLGYMAFVTRNHLSDFTTGVRFASLSDPFYGQMAMWRITDNMAKSAAHAVVNVLNSVNVLISGNKP